MAEPLRATFFTLQRRDRAVLAPATIVMVALLGLIVAAFVGLNWGFLSQIQTLAPQFAASAATNTPLPEEQGLALAAAMLTLVGTGLLLLFPLYLVVASYEAACLRWMIRSEVKGLFGLALDNDTWRVYGVYWCWLVLQLAVSMAVSVLLMPFMFASIGDVIGQGGAPDPEKMMTLQLRMHGLSMLQYIPLAFLGVRFGPAAATAVARQRFSFFEAWRVTRDRFWTLFGSFAVLMLIFGGIMIAPSVYQLARNGGESWDADALILLGAVTPETLEEYTREAAARYATPAGFALTVMGWVTLVVAGIGYALLSYGVNARAVLAALEEGKIEVAPAA